MEVKIVIFESFNQNSRISFLYKSKYIRMRKPVPQDNIFELSKHGIYKSDTILSLRVVIFQKETFFNARFSPLSLHHQDLVFFLQIVISSNFDL